MKIEKAHFFMKSAPQIEALIQPLKDYFGLTSLMYLKSFNDGSEIRLANQADWLEYFYNHDLYKFSLFERHPSEYIKAPIVWAGLAIYQKVLEKARIFDIDHGITFIEPCSDGCEFFFIGTGVNQANLMPKYLANLDLLQRYLVHFREAAQSLLQEAMHHKIIIPSKFENAPKQFCLKEFQRTEFLHGEDQIELTVRELCCARLLVKGYTQKMIAKELGISVRTVETHLNHIKAKTDTHSRGDLVTVLLKLDL
jgi:DNA-binding CsgD family transcriptional regulator